MSNTLNLKVKTKKYRVFIDLFKTHDEDEIPEVIELIVEAENAIKATDLIQNEIENNPLYEYIRSKKYYVWEVREEDVISHE